jgi:hypothetical protein|nr:MAG TPA: Head fiber protein [Caudoviricetes sp.]
MFEPTLQSVWVLFLSEVLSFDKINQMIQINFKENYILFSYPDGKYYGYKTGTIRHEIEGSAISFFLLDNEVGEQPVLNFNYLNCEIEGVQATEDNINDLLSVIYNGVTTDVKVISFTLDSDKNELTIKQNDETYFTVSLNKYDFTEDISNLITLINNEVERAKAAEKANADTIVAVDAAYKAADITLQGNIDAEVTRATNAESVLDTKIETLVTAEETRAKAEEARIEAKAVELVEAETERATEAESILDSKITSEVKSESDRAQAAEAALDTKIESEITRAKTEEERIEAKAVDLITTETERATEAEQVNADAIVALDAAYKAADATLDTKIDNLVTAEKERAISEETRIETKVEDLVNTETERAKAAEKANSDAIAAEVERAINAEKDLSDRIDANGDEVKSESDRAQAAEAELNAKIEAEITRATEAESVLNAKIDTEIKAEADRAKAEEARIETKAEGLVEAETERATAAEQANADAIAAEVSRAKAAEQVNATAIITEKERAVAAENIIRNSLNDEIGRAQEAEQANTTAIEAEVTRAKAEETRIETKFDGFVSNLDSKINSNKTAIEAEVERATTAETLIDKKIDDEVVRAKDAEKINSDSITNEVVRAKAAEKVIADDLNAEIIRAKAAEKANNDTINAEAERAQAAEVNIDGKLTIEVARATKAEEDFAVLLAGTSGSTSYSNIKEELDKLGDDYNSIRSIAVTLKNFLNAGGITDAVDSFKELQDFLAGITDSQTLAGLLLELKNEILGGAGDNINTLKKVYDALSGNTGGEVDLTNYYTKAETDSKVSGKVDKITGKGLSTNDYTTAEKSKLASLSNYDDTELKSLIGNTYTKSEVDAKIDEAVTGGEVDLTNYYTKAEIDSKVSGKVDKVTGKGLSTNDFTTALKTKLEGLTNYDDSDIRTSITNIQNMVEYTLIEQTVSNTGTLALGSDKIQHSVITRNTTISLPTVTKYTVIDFSFTVNSNYTVIFPSDIVWKSAPSEFKDGVEMEFIFTYNNNKWYAAYIEYGNN